MPLISEQDQYRKYYYQCMEMDVHFDDDDQAYLREIEPSKLMSFSITSDYVHDLFPVIHLKMSIERSLYFNILRSKNKAKLHLRIDKFYRELGRSEKSMYSAFINDTFDFVLDDDDSDLYQTARMEAKDMDYDNFDLDDTDSLEQMQNVVDFYVYKAADVDAMDTTVNKILQNATMQDAFQYIFNKIGLKNYLIGKMDNTKNYTSLMIPRLKARQAIRFLDTYYGTWRTGMLAFCDYDRSYFMKFSSECTVYTDDEKRETCIIIPDATHEYVAESCTLYTDLLGVSATHYVIADNTNTSIRNESISNQYINSNDVSVIDTMSGEVTESKSNTITRKSNDPKQIENNTENTWLGDIYTSISSASRKVISVNLQDYDIDAIKPNKRFTVYFTNTKSGKDNKGYFLLAQTEHYFLKESSEFSLSSSIVLRASE